MIQRANNGTVFEITPASEVSTPTADLGAQTPEERNIQAGVDNLLARMSLQSKQSLRVEWHGSKVPRGLRLFDRYEIGWTQNGVVTALDTQTGQNVMIGTYSREVEYGLQEQQIMTIFLNVAE